MLLDQKLLIVRKNNEIPSKLKLKLQKSTIKDVTTRNLVALRSIGINASLTKFVGSSGQRNNITPKRRKIHETFSRKSVANQIVNTTAQYLLGIARANLGFSPNRSIGPHTFILVRLQWLGSRLSLNWAPQPLFSVSRAAVNVLSSAGSHKALNTNFSTVTHPNMPFSFLAFKRSHFLDHPALQSKLARYSLSKLVNGCPNWLHFFGHSNLNCSFSFVQMTRPCIHNLANFEQPGDKECFSTPVEPFTGGQETFFNS